jgi:hypothetical protein
MLKKIGLSRLLIIYEIQVRRSTKVFDVSLSSLLKCLDHEQAKIAMGKVHEGICCTHQLA